MGINRKFLNTADIFLKILVITLIYLFILYPLTSVFIRAFRIDGFWTLREFTFLKNEFYLFKNTLLSAMLSSFFSVVFSVSIGLMMIFATKKQKNIIMFILMLTVISPPFITSLTYIELFGRNGFITKGILNLSVNPYGLWGIVSMQTLSFTPLNAMLLIGYLEAFDKTLINSARSLHASTSYILIDIIIPLIKPAIYVCFLLTFIRSISDFSTPTIIGGAFNTLATESYLSIIAKGNSARASAISVILFIPSLLVFLLYTKFIKKQQSASKTYRQAEVNLKKSGLFYLFAVIALFFLVWIVIQYTAIFISAFTDEYMGKIFFTLNNIYDSIPHIGSSFMRSFKYSIIAGVFSSVIALLFSYYAYIRKGKFMKVTDYIANMPYIVPGTFFGLGYIFAFNNEPMKLTGTALIVILNLIFRQLPVSIRALQSSILQIDKSVINSAKDLGAHNLFVLKDIVFPLSKSGLFLSFINSFISSMTTIGSIIFLVYPSRKVATMVLFDLVSSGKYKIASVLSCIMIVTCLIVNLISYRLYSGRNKNVS